MPLWLTIFQKKGPGLGMAMEISPRSPLFLPMKQRPQVPGWAHVSERFDGHGTLFSRSRSPYEPLLNTTPIEQQRIAHCQSRSCIGFISDNDLYILSTEESLQFWEAGGP